MPEDLIPDETQILAAMLGISEMIGGLSDLQELLGTVVRIVPQLVRANRCAIFTLDDEKKELRCEQAFAYSIEDVRYFSRLVIMESEIPRLSQKVLKQHLPALVKDATKEAVFPPNMIQALGLRTLLVVPLVARERALGFMVLDDTRGNRYLTSKEINIVIGIATLAAIAIESNTAREELSKERERLETVISSFSDAFMIFDSHFRIKYINSKGERMFGWKTEEIAGKKCSDIFNALDTNGVRVCGSLCPGKNALWRERPSKESQRLYFQKKDGSRILVEVRANSLRDSKGQTVEILYLLTQIGTSPGISSTTSKSQIKEVEGFEQVIVNNK